MNCWKLRGSALAIVFLVSASVGAGLSSLPAAWAESPAASGPTVGAPAAKAKKSPEQLRQEIEELTKKIEAEPKVAKNYGRRGLRYHELKEYEKALKDFDRALELDPKDGRVYGFKGNTLFFLGKTHEAIEQLTLAIKRGSDTTGIRVQRSICYQKIRDFGNAHSDALKATSMDPKDPLAWRRLGFVELRQSDFSSARTSYTRAIALDPSDGESYYLRAEANAGLHQEREALEDRAKANQLGFTITQLSR